MKPTSEDQDHELLEPRYRSDAVRPELSVVAQDDRVVQLACEGQLTPLPTSLYPDPLSAYLGPGRQDRSVILDLSRTDYINSTGISWLIQAHKHLLKRGRALVLHSLSPQVYSALELVSLLSVLKVAVDRSAALAVLTALATPTHGA